MPFSKKENDVIIEDEPPPYDSTTTKVHNYFEKEIECLQEENELLKKEITLLKDENSQLKQTKSLLEVQIELLREQVTLIRESKSQLDSNYSALSENHTLLQRTNSGLIDRLAQTTANEQQTLLYLEAFESCAALWSDSPEIASLRLKMQEFESSLQEHKGEVSAEIEIQINKKAQTIQENILELFDNLIQGEVFTKLVHDLEQKFTTIIHQDQESFFAELSGKIPAQNELTQQYLDEKTKKLIDLKQIREDDKANLFYNTSYIVLWAKIIGVLSLFSQLVEKKAGLGEKMVDLSSSTVGSLLGGVPFVGALLDTVASFALKEVGGAVIGYFDDKRTKNILEILQNPEHAKKMAELFARSLTLRHQTEIQAWDLKTIKSAATMYSNQVYELSIGGKIRDCKDEATEDKVAVFLGALKKINEKDIVYENIEKAASSLLTNSTNSSSPRPKFRSSQKSLKTSVQEGTQTIREKAGKAELISTSTSFQLESIKRQNFTLQERIAGLELEVDSEKKKREGLEEVVNDLKAQVSGLQEIMANWLTAPAEIDTPATPKSTKKTTIKEKLTLFARKDSAGNSKYWGKHDSLPLTTK